MFWSLRHFAGQGGQCAPQEGKILSKDLQVNVCQGSTDRQALLTANERFKRNNPVFKKSLPRLAEHIRRTALAEVVELVDTLS